ncbi:MAG: hypothetical protein O7D95_02915 [Betaproteobacteria bacterium]|nr:hypothetical protein [Betaproteobacteria bacterium]
MLLTDTGGSDFEPAPSGNHVARCVQLIDLGTTEQDYFGELSMKHQLFIMWELPHKTKTYKVDDQEVTEPFTASAFYTASLNEKANLRGLLESWRGKAFTEKECAGFNPKVLVGVPCMLNIIHKPNTKGVIKAKIAGATPLPEGFECPPQVHDSVNFSLTDFDQTIFDNLSKGLKAMVEKSEEYKSMQNPKVEGENPAPQETKQSIEDASADDGFDDIPF